MMRRMAFGRYIPTDSLIHRMDPRSKILLTFLFVCVVFIANNTLTYGILMLYMLLVILLSRISVTFLFGGLIPIIWVVLFAFVIQLFTNTAGEPLFQLGWIKIHEAGVRNGIFIAIRFCLLVLMTSLLTVTTTQIEITDGMEELLKPLKKLKFPVHELALMMSIALRFIPTLMQEADKIMKAQTARGIDFSDGSIKDRIGAIIPLLIPLFISSFRRAEDLAVAMEARGYRGGEGRTKYRHLQWGVMDTGMLLLLGIVIVLLFLIRT